MAMTLTTRIRRVAAAATLVAGALVGGNASAGLQTLTPLPAPDCGTPTSFTQTNNCITFGDFSVYSLNLLYYQAFFAANGTFPSGGQPKPGPGEPYYVESSPGELQQAGYIVYGTGTNNNGVVTNGNGTLIDDAQSNPEGTASSFIVSGSTETAPTFAGDNPNNWTGTLSAVRSELAIGGSGSPLDQFVIYFNLNETGNDGLGGIDLLAWFEVTLKDVDGGLADRTFYLGGSTAPDVDNFADPNWVYVHGTICVSKTAGFLGFGPCNSAQTAAGGINVNQNLGANQAAFAIYNPELSGLVLNSGYDIIEGTWRFTAINNGYEQQFSRLTPVGQNVPEPSMLASLAVGLLGLAAARRRRKVN